MPKSFNSNIVNFQSYFSYDFGLNINDNYAQMFLNFMVFVSLIGSIPLIWSCWCIYRGEKSEKINYKKMTYKIIVAILWIILGILTDDLFPILTSIVFMVFSLILIYLVDCR